MSNVNNSAQTLMVTIQQSKPMEIPDLDVVREKFISNYNACNKDKVGELMYHRNVIHFKQIISASGQLQKADPFSLYACFVTAAANGYSMDPSDSEVYLIARGGKACLDKQAGAYIKKLMRSGQILYAEQAKLVYQGDVYSVVNNRVVEHVEKFQSDVIIAGYIKMVIDEKGTDRYFTYRKSDWEAWRKKSANPRTIEKHGQNGTYISESLWDAGIIGGTQPDPGFLRTKITKHAANEKCWASGTAPILVEQFEEIEIDTDEDSNGNQALIATTSIVKPALSAKKISTTDISGSDDGFVNDAKPSLNGQKFDDDDF